MGQRIKFTFLYGFGILIYLIKTGPELSMFSDLKQRLRRRILGRRFQHRLIEDHRTLGRLGNAGYLSDHPGLLAPDFDPPFNMHEFSCYSQNGEDGLILYLLACVGVESHFVVEIGTEDGRECNSANLILNYGWRGCLIEAAEHWAEKAREYFKTCHAADRVKMINARAEPESINTVLTRAGVPAHIDVLSIDIDSYDYWLWRALDVVTPRIAVIEYNASFGPVRSVTIPYPRTTAVQPNPMYHGVSLTALQKLGESKGYILVGCDDRGVNSFFVRRDLAEAAGLKAMAPERAFRPHFWRTLKMTQEEQYNAVADMPLEEID